SNCKKQELLQAIATGRISARYDASIPLTKISFNITSYEVEVTIKGNSKKIPISGANIGSAASVLNQIGPGGSFVIKSIVCRSNTGASVRVAPIACTVQ
ncbi:MAG TPA: GldM family protein, partial [Flavobacteriales bacterium]|nr:GldM family protein [Flavobacteriales bacterium]